MLAMPGFILWVAKRLKLAPWLVATVSAILALVAAWGLITLLIHRHDNGVIAAHENKISAQVNSEIAAGTNAADAQANVTNAANQERHNEVQGDISNAVVAHPVEAHRSDGPASQAALDRLRRRK